MKIHCNFMCVTEAHVFQEDYKNGTKYEIHIQVFLLFYYEIKEEIGDFTKFLCSS